MFADDDPIRGLIHLYAHKAGSVRELEKCRINPDFSSGVRMDLEFYIPQLCCVYMQGEFDEIHELIRLMQKASRQDIFFSHRTYFFF